MLDPHFKDGSWVKGPKQAVERWDNQKALTIFEQMLQRTNGKIDASIAANDGLANAAISALKARKLPNIPITGQDATDQGIQHILAGEQLMTVYKPVQQEAAAAAKVAIALAKGQKPATNAQQRQQGQADRLGAAAPDRGDQGQHQVHGDRRRVRQEVQRVHGALRGPLHQGRNLMESCLTGSAPRGAPARLTTEEES